MNWTNILWTFLRLFVMITWCCWMYLRAGLVLCTILKCSETHCSSGQLTRSLMVRHTSWEMGATQKTRIINKSSIIFLIIFHWIYDYMHNRVEKSTRHVSMVAKKLDLNKSSMAAMSISALASFFADEPKLINRGENHYNSKHVESFEYADSVMRGNVHASMKNRRYKTTVSVKKLLIDWRDCHNELEFPEKFFFF